MKKRKNLFRSWTSAFLILFLFTAIIILFNLSPLNANPQNQPMRIIVSFRRSPVNRFIPSYAFGAAIDGHEKGEVDKILSPRNIKEMLTAGLKRLSYRLRTELAGEVWHWNPHGRWSEAGKSRGYWTSIGWPSNAPISLSYGYKLPRRGNTLDQANDDGYSRLDDGNVGTFWKSNPYLDQSFTGEENSRLPQWVIIDLGKQERINAFRLLWGNPFARIYAVQHGHLAGDNDISQALPQVWQTFPSGNIKSTRGGAVTIRLASKPVTTRFVRVLMSESSLTSVRRSRDVRDRVGYAIREIYVGVIDDKGTFHDMLRHSSDNHQTMVYVSSTDPWHETVNRDPRIEQPGLDRIFRSELANGLPIIIPVAVLYEIPENAAAEFRYLKARGYPVARIELGEEPDGQFVTPEDYAALYIQFARALHAVDPEVKLGGPSFQDIQPGEASGSIKTGKPQWLVRFLEYLKQRGRLDDYNFFSFEWYPFDDVCKPTGPQLAEAPAMLKNSLLQLQAGGLRRNTPWIITEYGYSAFGGRPEIDIEGALLNADIVGTFLTLGGEQTFLYGYEPNELIQDESCAAGNNMLFQIAENGAIRYRMPTYYGARLLTQEWAQPGDGPHELYLASVVGSGERDQALVTAYPVRRPDRSWALMVLNKDPDHARMIEVKFHQEADDSDLEFEGPIDLYQYSKKQFELSSDQLEPYPIRDQPPEHQTIQSGLHQAIWLPAYSLTIVRGRIDSKQ